MLLSFITWTTSGFTFSEGMVPAEANSTQPSARCLLKASAIWLRPELCTQTNRTRFILPLGVA